MEYVEADEVKQKALDYREKMGTEIPYIVGSYKEDPTDFEAPNPNDELRK
jgi:hypothetical protein